MCVQHVKLLALFPALYNVKEPVTVNACMLYISVFRFALAHEGKMCRRNVLLEYLGEESNTALAENGCCDVCSSDLELIDYQKEVSAAIQAVQEIPDYGERKVRLYQGRVVTVHQGCVIIVTPPYFSK